VCYEFDHAIIRSERYKISSMALLLKLAIESISRLARARSAAGLKSQALVVGVGKRERSVQDAGTRPSARQLST
jgi:hypothetical protein